MPSSTARRRRLALLVRGASPFSAFLTSPIHLSAVSRNSEIKMSYDEQKLRERAYELWTQGGRKEGRSDKYWFQAERGICSDRANPPQLRSVGNQDFHLCWAVISSLGWAASF